LVITAHDGDAVGGISVLDARGQLVTSASGPSNTLTLDVSSVPSGLLLVQRITSGGQRSVARVMTLR